MNFNLNANTYYAYMRQIASQHKEIGADIPNENRNHFFIGELQDFYNGLRSRVLFPALVVEGFSLNLLDNQEALYRESAFTVTFPYEQEDNYDQQTECFSKSEDIGKEILRKMLLDAENANCPISISDIAGTMILNNTERYAGIRFSFTLVNANTNTINKSKWNI